MNKFLLILAAAAFVAGTANAQTKIARGVERQLVSALNAKAQRLALPGGTVDRVGGKTIGSFNALNAKKYATLDEGDSEEDPRPGQMLSYMTDGSEKLTLLPIVDFNSVGGSINLMPMQLFPGDMLKRYAGNTVGTAYFYCGPFVYTNAKAYLFTDEGMKETVDVEAKPFDPNGESINATTAAFSYVITGKEKYIAIGLDADCSANAAYKSKVGTTLYMVGLNNNSGATGNSFLMMGIKDGKLVEYGEFATGWKNKAGEEFVCQIAQFVYTEGEAKGVRKNDASAYYTGNIRGDVNTGKGANGVMEFDNYGLTPISSIDYKYEANGKEKTGTATFETPIAFAGAGKFYYEGVLASTPGRSAGTLTITGVNGTDDEFADDNDNVASNEILSLSQGYRRIPVLEEVTSTACGYCPVGIVGLKKAEEKMGDKVVNIAIHTEFNGQQDELTSDSYKTVASAYGVNSYPSALINREQIGHAYSGTADGIWMDAARMHENVGEANMQVTSKFTNGLKTAISVESTIDFSVDAPEKSYAVVYALTEDSITGVDQLNYYASMDKSQLPEDLQYLCDEKGKVVSTDANGNKTYSYQPTFDHVARYINDPLASSEASLLPAVKSGDQKTHSTTISLKSSDLAGAENFNKANLKVAALLIDLSSGAIVTAAQAPVGQTSDWSGIESVKTAGAAADIAIADGAFTVTAQNAKAEVYATDGKLVSSCTVNGTASLPTFGKGVYVIRVVENGNVTTKKAAF